MRRWKGARLSARLEKLIHPRLLPLTHGTTVARANGLLLRSDMLLMAPLPLPLSNTLPAYSVLFLAVGSLERDGYAVLGGYVMVLLTFAYFEAALVLESIRVQTLLNNL